MSKESRRPSIVINEARNRAEYVVPDVCIHCGAPSTTKTEVLLRCPLAPWIVYIVALFLAEMLETKTSIVVPLCSKHQKAKDATSIMKLITLFLVIPLVIAGIVVIATSSSSRIDGWKDVMIGILSMTAGVTAGWLLIRTARAKRFYGKSVDERHLKLIGVSPAFAAAVSASAKTNK